MPFFKDHHFYIGVFQGKFISGINCRRTAANDRYIIFSFLEHLFVH